MNPKGLYRQCVGEKRGIDAFDRFPEAATERYVRGLTADVPSSIPPASVKLHVTASVRLLASAKTLAHVTPRP
ncbi:hypothetical protein DPMN_166612 [Dreissena polymorpha]|uniref:Uncharacterized protein n=1 Tax=Dreissena polymorpha TaxID=45954 RepID=A0A9D4EYX7_DREPO|nr:hypothetical protein DPMN_166612 [Dreissena polymorpha]